MHHTEETKAEEISRRFAIAFDVAPKHNYEGYCAGHGNSEPTTYNKYRQECAEALRAYFIGRTQYSSYDIDEYNEVQDVHYPGNSNFLDILKTVLDTLDELLSNDPTRHIVAVAWVNHLDHCGGNMLQDHSNISYELIDRISQNGLENVFDDIPM